MLYNEPGRYLAETSGALTPELEGAPHSSAHEARAKGATTTQRNRGDKPSAPKHNSPNPPKRP